MSDRAGLLRLVRDLRMEKRAEKTADLEAAVMGLFDEIREELNNEIDEVTAERNMLLSIVQKQEDQLNRILQPGERWLELVEAYRQSDEKMGWLSGYADELDLARMRLQEAIGAVLKEMVKR